MDEAKLYARLEVRVNEALRQVEKFNSSANFSTFERRARQASERVNASLRSSVKGFALGAIGGISASQAQEVLDSAVRIKNALKAAGLEGAELDRVYKRLFQSAQRNAAPIESMVELYSRLAQTQNELGVTTDELLGFTDKVGLALRVSGKSASEASGALLQLSQALGGGSGAAVRAEEFNSLFEGARPILQAAAAGIKEAGGSIGKLRQLMIDGKLSAGALFHGFEVGSKILEDKVAGAERTVASGFVQFQNVLIDVGKRFNETTGASRNLADFMNGPLTNAVQELGKLFEGLANGPVGMLYNKLGEVIDRAVQAGADIGEVLRTNQLGASMGAKPYIGPARIQDRIEGAFGNDPSGKGGRVAPSDKPNPDRTKDDKVKVQNDGGPLKVTVTGGRVVGNYITMDDYPVTGGRGSDGQQTAFDLIAKFERFRSEAYPDYTIRGGKRVNSAFRAGYGSDTYTTEAGEAVRVTKATVVTLQQATDDLNRRIGTYFKEISGKIGEDNLKALNEDQQAVLASIVHNYGQLPGRLVQPLQSGDPTAVHNAIRGLGSDNGGINRGRRNEEAEAYLSGVPAYVKEGIADRENFKTSIEEYRQQIAYLKEETGLRASLNPLVNDYGRGLSELQAAQQLLTLAQQEGTAAGLELHSAQQLLSGDLSGLSPAAREQALAMREIATAAGEAEAASNRVAESQGKIAENARGLSEFSKGLLSGFISDLRDGKSASEALAGALEKVADRLLDVALDSLFDGPMGQPGGGIFGGLFNLLGGLFSGKKNGGMVKAAGGGHIRGPGGPTGDKIPAMLSDGEFVVRASATKKNRLLLEAINEGLSLPRFAAGGLVPAPESGPEFIIARP